MDDVQIRVGVKISMQIFKLRIFLLTEMRPGPVMGQGLNYQHAWIWIRIGKPPVVMKSVKMVENMLKCNFEILSEQIRH